MEKLSHIAWFLKFFGPVEFIEGRGKSTLLRVLIGISTVNQFAEEILKQACGEN